MGAGFHWSMEKKLGYVINALHDFDRSLPDYEQIILEVALEGLYEDVDRAEASAKELKENPPFPSDYEEPSKPDQNTGSEDLASS